MNRWSDEQARFFADLFIGRQSDYALQRSDGRYRRVGCPVSLEVIRAHLAGSCTIGTYVMDEQGCCSFAVFDADQDDGLLQLFDLRQYLSLEGVPSYLEASRRGGHLWVFLETPLPARLLREWLLPFCPPGVEFYPKQDECAGYGSLIRVPLGVHRLTGKRYPFLVWQKDRLQPVASTLPETLAALERVERAAVPTPFLYTDRTFARAPSPTHHTHHKPEKRPAAQPAGRAAGIAAWCARQDPFALIGRYVSLDSRGMGRCPFEEHHTRRDRHPSFQVFQPKRPGGTCWRCYTSGDSGNVFNFLQRFYGLSAKELWTRLCRGEGL